MKIAIVDVGGSMHVHVIGASVESKFRKEMKTEGFEVLSMDTLSRVLTFEEQKIFKAFWTILEFSDQHNSGSEDTLMSVFEKIIGKSFEMGLDLAEKRARLHLCIEKKNKEVTHD